MSSKKESRILMAESLIPADLTTPTLGSNYGLEGFEDLQYGMGVLEGVLDPQFLPAPAVPSGLSKDGSDGMYLTAYMEEEHEGLVNHDWLANAVQDPTRLPETPHSIPELEEAWSQNNFAAATPHFASDLDVARLREGLPAAKTASPINMGEIAARAMRRSAAGVSLTEIERDVVLASNGDRTRAACILTAVQQEHGLVGKVFIRASAYPGYGSGKWKDHLKKYAHTARYVVVSPEEMRNASWVEGGRCTITGKQAVLTVPWAEAQNYYKAAGYSVQSSGDPKEILRVAFLSSPKRVQGNVDHLPTHTGQTSRLGAEHISSEKALAAFEGRGAALLFAKMALVKKQVEKGVRGDLLRSFIAATFTPPERKKAASLLLPVLQGDVLKNPAPVRHAYADTGLRPHQPKTVASGDPEFNETVKTAVLWSYQFSPAIEGSLVKAVSSKFGEAVARRCASTDSFKRLQKIASTVDGIKARIAQGVNGDVLKNIIVSSFSPGDVKVATRILAPHLKKTGALKNEGVKHTYADTGLRPNRTAVSTFDPVFEDQIQKALKFAGQSFSVQGDLKQAIRSTFSEEVSRRAFERRAFQDLQSAQVSLQAVSAEINRGSRGSVLRNFIAKTIRPEHHKIASKALTALVPVVLLENVGAETKHYAGTQFQQNVVSSAPKTAQALEARGAIRWVKKAMNEGYAGSDLDELISRRFAAATLKEASEELVQIREKHEGGAGFMYVEAAAYASPTGTTGCDSGALKHRANQLKMVLAMPRCTGCTQAQKLPDGSMKCGVYNKILLNASDLSSDEIQLNRQANIRSANASDSDVTASMFAPSWQNDFQLHNASLDDIAPLPENEKVSSLITFGGGFSW